ncbi:hypothetical protein [Marinicella litoralis]|uniref:Uncharacterized protein n=1 Tax=Marinicella litoralis TaxID=644220 RepID=A0A4R6XVA0_9GAMM|nr:hypothetical protein [Marinicella litoralis]TDR23756.1 hypothetical protein C8D91_0622 [Marinicella litoralis]
MKDLNASTLGSYSSNMAGELVVDMCTATHLNLVSHFNHLAFPFNEFVEFQFHFQQMTTNHQQNTGHLDTSLKTVANINQWGYAR